MISEKEIEKIVKLARLKVEKEEFERLKKDFLKILEFVEKLKELKLEKEVLKKIDFKIKNVFREDEKEKIDFDENLLISQAPEKMGRYFKIKRVLEK